MATSYNGTTYWVGCTATKMNRKSLKMVHKKRITHGYAWLVRLCGRRAMLSLGLGLDLIGLI